MLAFFVVEDDVPFVDDMLPDEGVVADPLVADELVLGLAVVAVLVLGDDDELVAGCAVVDAALLLAALWQPASAKRTADARINFFIENLRYIGGLFHLMEHTLQRPIISNVGPARCKIFFKVHPAWRSCGHDAKRKPALINANRLIYIAVLSYR